MKTTPTTKTTPALRTETWTCDACHEEITRVEDGWVEWLRGGERGRHLRVGHPRPSAPHGPCHRLANPVAGMSRRDLPLSLFLGPDGLMLLLEMMDDQEVPQQELMEMITRLHIPGYEAARKHFEAAMEEGVPESLRTPGFHSQWEMREVMEWREKVGG
jgi:hypothetical protein